METLSAVTEDSLIYEAMAVKGGRIVAVGKEQQILNKYSASRKLLTYKSDWVYPGFIDAHCHFLGYGLSLQQVELKGSKSFSGSSRKSVLIIDKSNISTWIEGRGWDQTIWDKLR